MITLKEAMNALDFEQVPPTTGAFISLNAVDFQRAGTLIRFDGDKWEHIIHLPDPYSDTLREVVESVGFTVTGLLVYLHHIGAARNATKQRVK